MKKSKKNLIIILSVSLIIIITIPSTILILIKFNKSNGSNYPSNMDVDEWLKDFDLKSYR